MQSAKRIVKDLAFPVPTHLTAKHINIDAQKMKHLRECIEQEYYSGWRDKAHYSKEVFDREADAVLIGRLGRYRNTYLPWIDAARRLKGLRVLEVGCGTGSSTLALAEQGAFVTAIDIDQPSLNVALARREAYGFAADIRNLNAADMKTLGSFDAIIYNAVLEHMTIAERLQSLGDGWQMLKSGGILVIVETPNRLWWSDSHTSKLPMFHSLPDELAYQYAKFSPRENFREIYRDHTDAESMSHFLRRGRGMSFHETDLCIGTNLHVVSSLYSHLGWREDLRRLRLDKSVGGAIRRIRTDRACKTLLRRIYPDMHEGWHEEYLHLILKKP